MIILQYLSYYFRCGNEPIIIALLNRGASLEQVDNTGLTALHHAVNSGQVRELFIVSNIKIGLTCYAMLTIFFFKKIKPRI